jgi:hypothetical protein
MLLTDLNDDGCYVFTDEPLALGPRIAIQIMMSTAEVRLTGRVDRGESGRAFGVEIDAGALSEESRRVLEGVLQDQRERRQYARQEVALPCRVDGVTTSGMVQVSNLSAGGCFIAARGSVDARSEVTIHAKCAGVELALTGRVVHVQFGRGFAVEFGNLPSDTRYLLEQFLTRAPVPSY